VIVCVCVSQFVSERSAILLVLEIKLIKETRRRVWRGRDRDGEIGKGQNEEGGCERLFIVEAKHEKHVGSQRHPQLLW
jgi:hypothetical protein